MSAYRINATRIVGFVIKFKRHPETGAEIFDEHYWAQENKLIRTIGYEQYLKKRKYPMSEFMEDFNTYINGMEPITELVVEY